MAAYTFVWDLGDVGIGLMTIFNMLVIFPLSKQAIDALNDYEKTQLIQRLLRSFIQKTFPYWKIYATIGTK